MPPIFKEVNQTQVITDQFHNFYCGRTVRTPNERNIDGPGGESRLNFSAKLPHRPRTKIGNFLTSAIEFKPYFIKETMVIRQIWAQYWDGEAVVRMVRQFFSASPPPGWTIF